MTMQMYVAGTTRSQPTRTVHLYRNCQTISGKVRVDVVEVRYPQEVDPRTPGPYRLCAYCKARRDGRVLRTLIHAHWPVREGVARS